MQHRIVVQVRRKGQPFTTAIELKTEHFDNLEELTSNVAQFIEEEIEQDEIMGED